MEYSFEFVGIAPVLSFFTHQQKFQHQPRRGAEYLGTYQCTLDALLDSVEQVPLRRGWHLDGVVDSVIHFWLNNAEQIQHWKHRLQDAGAENLLVARIADAEALRIEFESLLD